MKEEIWVNLKTQLFITFWRLRVTGLVLWIEAHFKSDLRIFHGARVSRERRDLGESQNAIIYHFLAFKGDGTRFIRDSNRLYSRSLIAPGLEPGINKAMNLLLAKCNCHGT